MTSAHSKLYSGEPRPTLAFRCSAGTAALWTNTSPRALSCHCRRVQMTSASWWWSSTRTPSSGPPLRSHSPTSSRMYATLTLLRFLPSASFLAQFSMMIFFFSIYGLLLGVPWTWCNAFVCTAGPLRELAPTAEPPQPCGRHRRWSQLLCLHLWFQRCQRRWWCRCHGHLWQGKPQGGGVHCTRCPCHCGQRFCCFCQCRVIAVWGTVPCFVLYPMVWIPWFLHVCLSYFAFVLLNMEGV